MTTAPPPLVPSVASLGPRAGRVAEGHIDSAFRRLLRGPSVTVGERMIALLTGEVHPFGNFALLSDSSDVAAAEAAVGLLADGGPASALLFSGGPLAAEVRACLDAAGYVDAGPMPAMAVDIDRLAPVAIDSGCRLVRVVAGGADSVAGAWADAFAEGYGIPSRVAETFSPLAIDASDAPDAAVQYFAILRDGRIVSTALVYLSDGVAGVYCVATVPSERGHGHGAHVTAQALRAALPLGYRVAVLQSSAMGHAVYRRLGFADVGAVPFFVRLPATT